MNTCIMAFELILLGALIFIFIISFCGLLQKIKQTYDRQRILAGTSNHPQHNPVTIPIGCFRSPMDAMIYSDKRLAHRREQQHTQRPSADSFTQVYSNPSFINDSNGLIFPGAPPPYSQYYVEPPPKYDEIVKTHQPDFASSENEMTTTVDADPGPPIYTITVEANNRN